MSDYDVVVIGADPPRLVPRLVPALDEAAAAWQRGDRRAALRLVGDETVHALCAVGPPSRVAEYVRALRAAGDGAAGRPDPGRRAGRRRRSAGHDHRPGRGAEPARAGPGSRALATMIALAQAGKRVLVEMDDVARLADAARAARGRTGPADKRLRAALRH